MTEHKQHYRIILEVFSLFIVIFFLGSCATRGVRRVEPPEWFASLTAHTEDGCYYLPVHTESGNEEDAAKEAANLVFQELMTIDNLASLYDVSADQKLLKKDIQALFYPEPQAPQIPVSLEQSEWVEENGYHAFFGYFCIAEDAGEKLKVALRERYFGSDDVLVSLLKNAESSEENGLLYQSAEALLKAAAYVSQIDGPISMETADDYIKSAYNLFMKINITAQQYPTRVDANSKVERPFSLRCMEGVVGVRDVEFLVQYKGKKRDGSIGVFEVRLVSDLDGYVSFYHPFLPFAGESEVIMSPGNRTLLTILRDLEPSFESASTLKLLLEEKTITFPFSVESTARIVPTGIVILHTDMTGANLNSSETSLGLREVLRNDGFDTEIMNLSPLEITAANEASFLRDLKAAYGGQYTRVIYGVVGINDFNIRNNVYKVETNGVLKVVDVQTGEILMTTEKSKTVESQDNALAVAASFRELGKAFAEELKDKLY